MDVREKLIEILRKPIFPHELADPTEAVADYLLDNGVTVQEWISVDERLPDDNDRVIAFRPNESETSAYKYCVMWGWSVKVSLKQHRGITHWMQLPKLPQPPKGE